MRIQRTVTSPRPIEEVFAYLADFTNTDEWDPGTIRTTRQSGDGGVGSRYLNVSRFMGRRTELTYEVLELHSPARLRLRGENKTVVAVDTMTLTPTATGGTAMTYTADFTFKGLAKLIAPFTTPAFKKLGDEAQASLRRILG